MEGIRAFELQIIMLNYSSFSLTYYHEERYSRTNNGEAEIRSNSFFPEKMFAKFMPWNGLSTISWQDIM